MILRVTDTSYYNPAPDVFSNNSYHKRVPDPSLILIGKPKQVTVGTLATPKSTTQFSYDSLAYDTAPTKGNLTKVSAWDDSVANGQWIDTLTTYTTRGNVQSTTDPEGNVAQITYGLINGFSDLYPTQTISAYGTSIARTSAAAYDFSTGLVTRSTDLDNNISVAMAYDILGRPVKTRNAADTPLESWTTTEYSDFNRRVIVRSDLETIQDGKRVTVQHYDQLGRVRLSRSLENSATESPYEETHGIKVETRYKTTGVACTWDDAQGPIEICSSQLTSNPFRAATASTAGGEESMGWTLSQSRSDGRHSEVETFGGAALPKPFTTTGFNTNSTGVVKSDANADRSLVTDQAGKKRISRTNAVGQLKDVWEVTASGAGTEPISFGTLSLHGYKTSYNYDTLNNLTTVNQGVQTRSFTYSSLSRLLSATNPESGLIQYVYDNNGNLTQKTDARNVVANYVYDAMNRVTQRSYAAPSPTPANYQTTPTVTYTYGTTAPKVGKLTKVSSSISTTEYTAFDILGRVTGHKQTTDGTDYTTGYVYNLSGAMIEETYPSGRKVRNVLDNAGDLAQVQSQKNASDIFRNYASSFVYTAAGAVSSMKLGNGKFENTQFNSRLQPTQIGLGASTSTQNLLKLNYDYGTAANNGNIQSQIITVPTVGSSPGFVATQTYTYDSLNRIKDAIETIPGQTPPSWNQTFEYDRYGNRTFDEGPTTTLPKTCGSDPNFTVCVPDKKKFNPGISASDNRIIEDQDNDDVDDYKFDSAGNTIRDVNLRKFTYDGENKQVKVETVNSLLTVTGTVGEYVYDGDGKRVKKKGYTNNVLTEETIFVYDAGGKLVAEYSTEIASIQNAKVAYLTNDHLGSPRINTDATGNVTARHDYHPFGEEIASSQRTSGLGYADDTIRKQFTGYERDNETGLDFAQARYFDLSHGRFSSPDPLLNSGRPNIPQSWNRYVYALNNPLMYTDPTGFWEWSTALGGSKKDKDLDKERDQALKNGDTTKAAEIDEILSKRGHFVASLAEAKNTAGKITDKSVRKETLKGLNSYGKAGDGNNVTVAILDENDPGAGATVVENNKIIVAFADINLRPSNSGLFSDIAHEGRHVTRSQEFIACGGSAKCSISNYAAEMDAYTTSSMMVQAAGFLAMNTSQEIEIWNKSWASPDKTKLEATRTRQVEKLVNKLGYTKTDGIPALPGKAKWR